MCDLNKPLFQCTLGEFAEAVAHALLNQSKEETPVKHEMPKGMQGIMSIFGCTEYTARKIKRSGIIDAAIYQLGAKVFVTDPERARELYNESNQLIN